MNPELKSRLITSLTWMIMQLCWQFDEQKRALGDEGSIGGYSPELQAAKEVLEELKSE